MPLGAYSLGEEEVSWGKVAEDELKGFGGVQGGGGGSRHLVMDAIGLWPVAQLV